MFCLPQGKYILTPCPISYAEEQLLQFFGQLLGIAIRADVPLPLDLLGSFWKGLFGEALDPEQDLQEADVLTYNYVKKFENVSILPVPANTMVLIIYNLILLVSTVKQMTTFTVDLISFPEVIDIYKLNCYLQVEVHSQCMCTGGFFYITPCICKILDRDWLPCCL